MHVCTRELLVLQVNTGRFYGPDDNVRETPFALEVYTNACTAEAVDVDVSDYTISYQGGVSPRTTVTISGVERLGNLTPDGSTFGVSTFGGRPLVEDLSTVLSFILGATFSTDAAETQVLVPDQVEVGPFAVLARPRTPGLLVTPGEVASVGAVVDRLVTLPRAWYTTALRAMRAIVLATRVHTSDPTLAYALHVFALESLAQETAPEITRWGDMPAQVRDVVDPVLEPVAESNADLVRAALMHVEKPGALQTFRSFVEKNVAPSYYRDRTAGLLPLRVSELRGALDRAYNIRSGAVHELAALLVEEWIVTGGFDTVRPALEEVQLAPDGMHRLARHVILTWLERCTPVDAEVFNWRSIVPGIVRMAVAPEHTIHMADGLTSETATAYFAGAVEIAARAIAGRREGLIDLRDVLNKAAKLIGQAPVDIKPFLVALHLLWARTAAPELHPASSQAVIAKHGDLVKPGSLLAFVLDIVTRTTDWGLPTLQALANERRTALASKAKWPVPRGVAAAVFACLAVLLASDGAVGDALAALDTAIGELPGDPQLLAFEAALQNAGEFQLDPLALLLPPEQEPPIEEQTA